MKLKNLLVDVKYTCTPEEAEREITNVAYDSRKVSPGGLFVCLRGEKVDGHSYISQAIQAGAVALVVEELPEYPVEAALVLVEDSRWALAHISAAWFGNPAKQMTMIGVTGTKGKTTTAHMIKKILEEAGHKVGMIGTMGSFVGDGKLAVETTTPTTPEAYELHMIFSEMQKAGCDCVVMEVSSQGLKLKRTEGIRFDYGVFLNISPDHIGPGEHADFAEYLSCKKMLFSQAETAIVNIDDPHWKEIASETEKRLTISTHQNADFQGDEIERVWEPGLLGTAFVLSGKEKGRIALNMPGRFNVENALAAIAVTSSLGIGIPQMADALKKVSVKGRTQLLTSASHFSTFIIDYAHNALSMESLLQTLLEYRPGRLICLFGGGGNKPKQRRYDMGLVAGKYADLTVLTMDNPRYEEMESINQDIIKGLEVHGGAYMIIDDREEAIHYLIDHCGKDDMVALIGKGHEEYQEVKGVKYPFSEEKIVANYLETK